MNTLDNITNTLFSEFSKMGKYVSVSADGNVLYIKSGTSDTRILNWETVPVSSILETARSLVLKENYKGNVLLHG
jgi:hypothetical protein